MQIHYKDFSFSILSLSKEKHRSLQILYMAGSWGSLILIRVGKLKLAGSSMNCVSNSSLCLDISGRLVRDDSCVSILSLVSDSD